MGEEYVVSQILDKRTIRRRGGKGGKEVTEYQIKWAGYDDPDDNTWEPIENLTGCQKKIDDFEKSYQEAVGAPEAKVVESNTTKQRGRPKKITKSTTVQHVKSEPEVQPMQQAKKTRRESISSKQLKIKIQGLVISAKKKATKQRANRIVGMKLGQDRQKMMLMNWNDNDKEDSFIPLSRARIDHPQLVIDYFTMLVDVPCVTIERVDAATMEVDDDEPEEVEELNKDGGSQQAEGA